MLQDETSTRATVIESIAHPDEPDRGDELPEPELIDRARAGGTALDRLLERIRPLVQRWALVALGDVDRAADVTQRVLISVYGHLEDFRGEAGFRAWLYRLTANAVVDEHRGRRRSERLRDAMLRHDAPATGESRSRDIHDRIDAVTVRLLVQRFAEELPERQRQVFDLCDLQGLESAEVARMMGIAPSTARVHLLRARRRMRELVIERNPEIEEEYGAGA